MIKILYIVSTLRRVGPVNQLSYIVKHLNRSRFEPIILTLSPEYKNSLLETFQDELHVKVERLDLSRAKGFFFAKAMILDFIKKNDIDIVHTQGVRADVLSSYLDVELKKISTVRNYPQLDLPMTYGRIVGYLMTRAQIKALKRMDVCCGVSEAVSKNLRDKFGLSNVVTVRNGVDLEKFFPVSKEEKQNLKNNFAILPNKKVWISMIGKDYRKDATTVAKAFKRLHSENENSLLIFVGDGIQKSECEKILNNTKDVIFLGEIAGIETYLQCADYYVSASYAEGMPNAVMEAMACGLPVVLSNIEPHREILELGEQAGILYEAGSASALYDAMKKMGDQDQYKKSQAALNTVKNNLESSLMS